MGLLMILITTLFSREIQHRARMYFTSLIRKQMHLVTNVVGQLHTQSTSSAANHWPTRPKNQSWNEPFTCSTLHVCIRFSPKPGFQLCAVCVQDLMSRT